MDSLAKMEDVVKYDVLYNPDVGYILEVIKTGEILPYFYYRRGSLECTSRDLRSSMTRKVYRNLGITLGKTLAEVVSPAYSRGTPSNMTISDISITTYGHLQVLLHNGKYSTYHLLNRDLGFQTFPNMKVSSSAYHNFNELFLQDAQACALEEATTKAIEPISEGDRVYVPSLGHFIQVVIVALTSDLSITNYYPNRGNGPIPVSDVMKLDVKLGDRFLSDPESTVQEVVVKARGSLVIHFKRDEDKGGQMWYKEFNNIDDLKRLGHKCIKHPINLNQEKEINMSKVVNPLEVVDHSVPAVEVRTFIYGKEAENVSDEVIFSTIQTLELEIKGYSEIKNKPVALKAKIKALEDNIANLVQFCDERSPKSVDKSK